MKKLLFILFAFPFVLASCSSDDVSTAEYVVTKQQLTVASVERENFFTDYYKMYFVKYNNTIDWQSLVINNLEHEEGYEYEILAEVRQAVNPDIGLTNANVLEVISKTKMESANIPTQLGGITVASKPTGDSVMPYYIKKYIEQNDWSKFPPIIGFEYEEGYEYLLNIFLKYNGSQAKEKYTYSLDNIFMKTKRTSQGLPY